jgi:hypothetical protein
MLPPNELTQLRGNPVPQPHRRKADTIFPSEIRAKREPLPQKRSKLLYAKDVTISDDV